MPTDQTPEPLTLEEVWELLYQRDNRWGYLKAWATAEPEIISRETLLDMIWGLEATFFEPLPGQVALFQQSTQHGQ